MSSHGFHPLSLRAARRVAGIALAGCAALWFPNASTAQSIDPALTELVSPASGCMLGVEPVTIRIFNNNGPALAAGTTILAMFSVDGGSASNHAFTLDEALPTNASRLFTFAAGADLSTPGDHTFSVSIHLGTDTNPHNNGMTNLLIRNTAASNAGVVQLDAGSASVSVDGQLGDVVQWEESVDGLRWIKLANTDTTLAFAALSAPVQFRVRVANAPCPAAASAGLTVTP
jgi:hypothetical protein